jgi:hypothetical protein
MQTKYKYEESIEKNKKYLINKLDRVNERIKNIQEKNRKEAKIKFEKLTEQRDDKYENVLRYERVKEFEREKKLDDIHKRMQRI